MLLRDMLSGSPSLSARSMSQKRTATKGAPSTRGASPSLSSLKLGPSPSVLNESVSIWVATSRSCARRRVRDEVNQGQGTGC